MPGVPLNFLTGKKLHLFSLKTPNTSQLLMRRAKVIVLQHNTAKKISNDFDADTRAQGRNRPGVMCT